MTSGSGGRRRSHLIVATATLLSNVISGNSYYAVDSPLNVRDEGSSTVVNPLQTLGGKSRLIHGSRELQNDENDIEVDLTSYSIKYRKCQYVKMYDDDVAAQGQTVLALKAFVVYRMCPSETCAKGCDYNYGEYVVEVDDYLQAIAKHNLQQFEEYCNSCEENCGDGEEGEGENNAGNNRNNNGNSMCAGCINQCTAYENLQDNGYVDATNYIECQGIYIPSTGDDDAEDDDGSGELVYVGPHCLKENKYSDKTAIRIGVFYDEKCEQPYYGASIEEVLGYKINYHMLKTINSNCIACEADEDNSKDEEQEGRALEVCENMYQASAKCETKHGFNQGLSQVRSYENQVENENSVCTFVDSLVWNSYNENGEIEINEPQDVYDRVATSTQKWMITLLSMTIAGFFAYIYILHREIDQGYPRLRRRLGLINQEHVVPGQGEYA